MKYRPPPPAYFPGWFTSLYKETGFTSRGEWVTSWIWVDSLVPYDCTCFNITTGPWLSRTIGARRRRENCMISMCLNLPRCFFCLFPLCYNSILKKISVRTDWFLGISKKKTFLGDFRKFLKFWFFGDFREKMGFSPSLLIQYPPGGWGVGSEIYGLKDFAIFSDFVRDLTWIKSIL